MMKNSTRMSWKLQLRRKANYQKILIDVIQAYLFMDKIVILCRGERGELGQHLYFC